MTQLLGVLLVDVADLIASILLDLPHSLLVVLHHGIDLRLQMLNLVPLDAHHVCVLLQLLVHRRLVLRK